MSVSDKGMLEPAPLLLTSMSRLPPVRAATEETHAAVDGAERTSRGRVSMPRALKWAILDGLRAVARTRRPRLWKAWARASPRPPWEQPVMRTVLGVGGEGVEGAFFSMEAMIGMGGWRCWMEREEGGKRREENGI